MQRYNCKDTRMSINKMFCVCFAAVLLTTGCSTDKANEWFVTHNGNMPSNERIAQISVGDTRDEVSRVLGAPSSVVSFDKNTWIYMSSDVRRIAFFAPEEINRDVLTIKFNDEGEVVAVNRLNKQNGQEIAVNTDETKAYGQNPGFFQKYFGGVGQYNPFGLVNSSQL